MFDLTQLSEWLQPIRWPLTAAYLASLILLCLYGIHRYWLTVTFYRTRHRKPRIARRFDELPRVTIQLPMYNEPFVAERIIESACKVNYPADRLQVQVLDDSDDDSAEIVNRCVERMQQQGHDVQLIRRRDRSGFKAGALQHGLAEATGELLAVFDADFIVPRDFLQRTVHHFTEGDIGFVQACWQHINRDASVLTRSQAIFLDSHFLIEHAARNRSGRWMNFNGTAGLWRRSAIEAAGGWQADTLTEDVDLSYRAQLAGWRGVYLPEVQCPAELPPETRGFKSQQRRWAKGSVQVGRKLLGRIWRSPVPFTVKIEATLHLLSPLVYPAMVATLLLTIPALLVNLQPLSEGPVMGWLVGLGLFIAATASGATIYLAGVVERGRPLWRDALCMPMFAAIGIGIALGNAGGVLEALLGIGSPFVRTPKYRATHRRIARRRFRLIALPANHRQSLADIALAGYLTAGIVVAIMTAHGLATLPFLLMFAGGYWYVGLTSLNLRAD